MSIYSFASEEDAAIYLGEHGYAYKGTTDIWEVERDGLAVRATIIPRPSGAVVSFVCWGGLPHCKVRADNIHPIKHRCNRWSACAPAERLF